MAKTRTFAANDAGDPEPVTVQTVCSVVTVGEDPSVGATWADFDFLVYRPAITDTPRQRPGGSTHQFKKSPGQFWEPGDICGYVAQVSGGGATSFFQEEE